MRVDRVELSRRMLANDDARAQSTCDGELLDLTTHAPCQRGHSQFWTQTVQLGQYSNPSKADSQRSVCCQRLAKSMRVGFTHGTRSSTWPQTLSEKRRRLNRSPPTRSRGRPNPVASDAGMASVGFALFAIRLSPSTRVRLPQFTSRSSTAGCRSARFSEAGT